MANWTTHDRYETFTPGSAGVPPKLHIAWENGATDTLEGDSALANYGGEEGQRFRAENPARAAELKFSRPDDYRNSWANSAGRYVRDVVMDPASAYNRYMDKGPVAGAALGTGAGLLGGILANWVSDAGESLGFGQRSMDYKLIGALLGAGLGGASGYYRQTHEKKAAMFTDPRNFILEKLQGSNDVSMSDKIKLAAAVRNMSRSEAERLATKLRATLGLSVGVLIARYLGLSVGGALLSGIAGIMGAGLINNLANKYF